MKTRKVGLDDGNAEARGMLRKTPVRCSRHLAEYCGLQLRRKPREKISAHALETCAIAEGYSAVSSG
jgi:hypothetical protein